MPDHDNYTEALKTLIGNVFSVIERPKGSFEVELARRAACKLVHKIYEVVEEAKKQGTSDSRIDLLTDILKKLETKSQTYKRKRDATLLKYNQKAKARREEGSEGN